MKKISIFQPVSYHCGQNQSEGEKMKNNKLLLPVLGMVLLSLWLAACSAKPEANFPTGKFIKSGTTNEGLIFNADGTFTKFEAGHTLVRGTYSVDGNVYTETSNDGGCDSNIAFTYTFDGTNITFNYVGNPEKDAYCGNGGRKADFDNVTYTLSE